VSGKDATVVRLIAATLALRSRRKIVHFFYFATQIPRSFLTLFCAYSRVLASNTLTEVNGRDANRNSGRVGMNARIKARLENRGVVQVKSGQRNENPLVAAAEQMARDRDDLYCIIADLTRLSAHLPPPPPGETENIHSIAREALFKARLQRLVDLGYARQEAESLLIGPWPTPETSPPSPHTPDHMMRLYKEPDAGADAPADTVTMREKSAERNRRDRGISATDIDDLRIVREEAGRAYYRRGGLTFDELMDVGHMVIVNERLGDGSRLHGALLRLRIRRRIVRAIARRNINDYDLILMGLMQEQDPEVLYKTSKLAAAEL
jgi:hypothetical protein